MDESSDESYGKEPDSPEEDPSEGSPFEEGEGAGDGAGRVTLSEAAQATEDVLQGCRQELRFLRRRLLDNRQFQDDDQPKEEDQSRMENQLREEASAAEEGDEVGEEDLPSPAEQALRVASRLEACAAALRNASAPGS